MSDRVSKWASDWVPCAVINPIFNYSELLLNAGIINKTRFQRPYTKGVWVSDQVRVNN